MLTVSLTVKRLGFFTPSLKDISDKELKMLCSFGVWLSLSSWVQAPEEFSQSPKCRINRFTVVLNFLHLKA